MNLANVDLNLLVVLDALLAERNVTRAAGRLGMTQPGTSNCLARLRKTFGDPLLVRQGRDLVPTPYADALAGPVHEVLTLVQHTLQERPHFDPGRDARTFTVSASDYATLVLIAPLLQLLAAEAPQVRLHVCPRAANVPALLHRDEVDLVIEPEELMADAAFPARTLLQDMWVCAVWAGNTQVGTRMTLRRYTSLPHLVYSIGSSRSLADQHLDRLGIQRNIEFTVESFLLAPSLLQGTNLTTLVPGRSTPMLERAADIRLLDPPVQLPPITEALWWHPRHTSDPAHAWLRDRICDVAATLDAP